MDNQLNEWNRIFLGYGTKKPKYDNWLDKYHDYLNESKIYPIIDLGCGFGNDTLYLVERGFQVISCDYSIEALNRLKFFVKKPDTRLFNILEGLPFKDNEAHIIIADLSIHYFSWIDTIKIINDISRVLLKDGYFICRVNSVNEFKNEAGQRIKIEDNFYDVNGKYKRFFDQEQMLKLFKNWEIVNMEEYEMKRYKEPKNVWEIAIKNVKSESVVVRVPVSIEFYNRNGVGEFSLVNQHTVQPDLSAGCFSSWLRQTRHTLIKENGVNVPCGECNACCTSAYFIHIRPEETQTLKMIPKELLFPAPGLPKGHRLLGYDQDGRCPMLIDNKCSIYEYRPLTCRNYDCRIFTAAGIAAGDEDKALITQRLQRWKFSYPTQRDYDQHVAVQAAAMFIQKHSECFPDGVPTTSSQLALVAIKVYEVFLKYSGAVSDREVAKAIMEANRNFEVMRDKP